MTMMVLVSKQHKVTTKYKDAVKKTQYSLICGLGEDIIIHKCRTSRFCCRQVDFQVTCPAGRTAVRTIFKAYLDLVHLNGHQRVLLTML